eukprot:426758_1
MTTALSPTHIMHIIYCNDGHTQIQPTTYPQQFAQYISAQQWTSFMQRLGDIGSQANKGKQCNCCYYGFGCKCCTWIWLIFCLIAICGWSIGLIASLNNPDSGSIFVFGYQVGLYTVMILVTVWAMYSCKKEVKKGRKRRYESVVGECSIMQSSIYNRLIIQVSEPMLDKSFWVSQITININHNPIQASGQTVTIPNYQNTQAIPLTIAQPMQQQPQEMLVQMPDGTYVKAKVISGAVNQQIVPMVAQNTAPPQVVVAPPYNPNHEEHIPLQNEGGNTVNQPKNAGNGEGGAMTNY